MGIPGYPADPMQGFTRSTRTRLVELLAWVLTFGFIAITVVGGYMIHPGLALLAFGYHLQNLAGAVNSITLSLLRKDLQAHMAKLAVGGGLYGSTDSDVSNPVEAQIDRELQQVRARAARRAN